MSSTEPASGRYNQEQYFSLAECGIIAPDDRVELLDGLVVAMTPSSPSHASTVNRVQNVIQRKLGADVNLRIQLSFLASDGSVPEPDIAVVAGVPDDYRRRHPSQAHLIVEVSETSVAQDRITKSRIYARAGVPCYWIVNVRDGCVEVFRAPDRRNGVYADRIRVTGSGTLVIDAFPAAAFVASELLPPIDDGD